MVTLKASRGVIQFLISHFSVLVLGIPLQGGTTFSDKVFNSERERALSSAKVDAFYVTQMAKYAILTQNYSWTLDTKYFKSNFGL